jgi:uncharacterized damage-inducible protein DinB
MTTTASTLLQRLNQHRTWVNENLLAAAATLSEEELHRIFPIGQGSIWKSLVHMYAAEYVWIEALEGNDDPCCPGDVRGKLPGNQLGEGGIKSFAELREKWAAQELRWSAYVESLSAESLEDPVYRVSTSVSGGERFVARRSDGILHVCLHAHYTTAQVINMFRQLGVENFPKTMMIQLIWQEGTLRM